MTYQVNLDSRGSRHRARQLGMDIPKQKPGPKRKDVEQYLNKSGDCWIWLGSTNPWGYGTYVESRKKKFAHREMYKKHVGEIPMGFVVLHKCDNPACCNPAHLSVGTHRDNQLDKVAKNRQAKGEVCGSSILTVAQVLTMRELYATKKFTYKRIAELFEVCRDTAQKAIRGINWGHI